MHVMNMTGGQALGLRLAILFYGQEDPMSQGYEEGRAFVTVNPVQAGQIQAGTCLDEATMAHLVRLVSGQSTACEVLPPNVLYASGDRMLWYSTGRRETIWFASGRRDLDALSGKQVAYPPLLFLARPGRLSVWALRQATRPEANTPLYRAPFFNIYADGKMCEGNIALPKSLDRKEIALWEKAFYSTEFTFSNYGNLKITSHKHGHDGLWRDMVNPKARMFPGEHLVPLTVASECGPKSFTVQEALNQ